MKNNNFIFLLFGFVMFFNSCNTKNQKAKDNDSPTIKTTYFGENPPDLIPQIFAPGVISLDGRQENGISFSPDLDEVYFSAQKKDENPRIYFSKLEEKKWSPIKEVNFTKGEKKAEMHPFVDLSGEKIYFTAYDATFTDEKIWSVNRLDSTWSNPKKLDSPINNDLVFYPNKDKNGNLFYTNVSKIKMNYAPNKDGQFPEVNEVAIEFGVHGFIAPSGDFLVLNAQNKEDETRKDNDIYVCFNRNDSTWTKPINLGVTVNSKFDENTPSISPDGKYLFFCRRNKEGGTLDIYWVSTDVIHKVRPVDL